MLYENGAFVGFEPGDKAMVVGCTDESLRCFWDKRLEEFVGQQVTITQVLHDPDGCYYRILEGACLADQIFLDPISHFEGSSEKENESELSQPQMGVFLSEFKVV